jgi:hypothetical protein
MTPGISRGPAAAGRSRKTGGGMRGSADRRHVMTWAFAHIGAVVG